MKIGTGALAVLLLSSGAGAAFAQAPCTLYEGDGTLSSVRENRKLWDEKIHRLPEIQRDYCRMAHLEYRMSRWFPQQREEHLTQCIDYSDRALRMAQKPQSGTAYFLRGLCRGRLGEERGFWASLGVITPFQKDMTLAMRIDPTVDFGGPHRALGKLYYELPFFLGGDMEKSIEHLLTAIKLGPGYWENHFYLAQSYMSEARYRDAKKELERARELAKTARDHPDIKSYKKTIRELIDKVNRSLKY